MEVDRVATVTSPENRYPGPGSTGLTGRVQRDGPRRIELRTVLGMGREKRGAAVSDGCATDRR